MLPMDFVLCPGHGRLLPGKIILVDDSGKADVELRNERTKEADCW